MSFLTVIFLKPITNGCVVYSMADEKQEAERQAHDARVEAARAERAAADAARDEADAKDRRADDAEDEAGL